MRGVRLERAVLIEGRHHDCGQELLVGRGIDMETASLLLRQQAGVAIEGDTPDTPKVPATRRR